MFCIFSCEPTPLLVIDHSNLTKYSLTGNRGGGGQRNFLPVVLDVGRMCSVSTIPVADQPVYQSMAHGCTDPAAQRCGDRHHSPQEFHEPPRFLHAFVQEDQRDQVIPPPPFSVSDLILGLSGCFHMFRHNGMLFIYPLSWHNFVMVDVPMLQHAEEHTADVFPSVRARHGLDIQDDLFPFLVVVNKMTCQTHQCFGFPRPTVCCERQMGASILCNQCFYFLLNSYNYIIQNGCAVVLLSFEGIPGLQCSHQPPKAKI